MINTDSTGSLIIDHCGGQMKDLLWKIREQVLNGQVIANSKNMYPAGNVTRRCSACCRW